MNLGLVPYITSQFILRFFEIILSFSIDQTLRLNFSSISINSDVFEVDDEEVIYHDPKEDYRNPKYDCQDQKEDYRNIKYDRYDVKNDLKNNCRSPNNNQKNEEKKQVFREMTSHDVTFFLQIQLRKKMSFWHNVPFHFFTCSRLLLPSFLQCKKY